MIIKHLPLFEGASQPALTAYIRESGFDTGNRPRHPAIVICPGGGFISINEKEAEPIALVFSAAGFQVFVLRYSIGAGYSKFPAPFIEAALALMMIRRNSERWGIDPNRISLCGFSTGGLVASTLAATWHEEYLAKALNAENQLFKPNTLILGYPVLDMKRFYLQNLKKYPEREPFLEMMLNAVCGTARPDEKLMDEWHYKSRITANMPSTFLWMTHEDTFIEVQDGLEFIKVLSQIDIPYEFHIFEKAHHGWALEDIAVQYGLKGNHKTGNAWRWMDLVLNWLETFSQVSPNNEAASGIE